LAQKYKNVRAILRGRMQMDCHDKRSLWRKYALYARAYSEAIGQLIAFSSLAPRSEWELAWDLASRARLLCEDARDQLQQHTAEHGCYGLAISEVTSTPK
jgi:hypothetical protein